MTPDPTPRPWMSAQARAREHEILGAVADLDPADLRSRIEASARAHRTGHDERSINLNPATNVMSPRAEALLAQGLGTRPSLGDPGEKYETGLEHLEDIEVTTMELARRVFRARHAEVRVASGAMANLYAFMATCRPGDAIIVPPASIGGHVTHHQAGAAGLFGLDIHVGVADPATFSYDLDALAEQARAVRPALITVGTSLNLREHPVAAIAGIARSVDARLLFDAAHACGMVAAGLWQNPLAAGADLMTMSTYKSLGGPPGGLVVCDDDDLAARLARIAYPGLTANFDIARVAALGVALTDWLEAGRDYGAAMVANAQALATGLADQGLAVHQPGGAATTSHQLALEAAAPGEGRATALRLARARLLVSDIGLPTEVGEGVRLGTPEVTRLGFGPQTMAGEVAELIGRALRDDPSTVADDVSALRARHRTLHFTPSHG